MGAKNARGATPDCCADHWTTSRSFFRTFNAALFSLGDRKCLGTLTRAVRRHSGSEGQSEITRRVATERVLRVCSPCLTSVIADLHECICAVARVKSTFSSGRVGGCDPGGVRPCALIDRRWTQQCEDLRHSFTGDATRAHAWSPPVGPKQRLQEARI